MLTYKTLLRVTRQKAGYGEDAHHFGCATTPPQQPDLPKVVKPQTEGVAQKDS
jgi:hypothetical protein